MARCTTHAVRTNHRGGTLGTLALIIGVSFI
jgi:hypothetical protein